MRTKKAIKNAIVSLIYQFTVVICGLITPRLILEHFGSTYNGVLSSANQFLGMISLLTLGIAGATRVALYKPIADHDISAISRIMKSNKRYMRKVGLAIVFYTALLCAIYPFVSHNDLSNIENAMLIAIVGVGVFAQYFFGISNQTLLSADQASYIYYGIQCLTIIANTILSVFLIEIGCTIYFVKLGSSIVFLLSPMLLNFIVKRKYNLKDNCEPDDTAIKQRGAVAFHSIANIVHENTDLIVLTLFTDAKLISVYTVYQLVVGKIRTMLLMLTNGLEGAFGNMWAKKEMDSFERNFRYFEFIIFSLTSIVFSCVFVLIVPFIRLYTSGVNDINYIRVSFAVLTVITESIYCIRDPYLIVVQATGNYEATKKAALFEAVINLGVSFTLVTKLDLCGVMLGTLIANTFRTIHYAVFISRNIILGSIKGTLFRFAWFLGNSFIVILFQILIVHFLLRIYSWEMWIVGGIVSVTIAIIITFTSSFLFFREDLLQLLNHVKKTTLKR